MKNKLFIVLLIFVFLFIIACGETESDNKIKEIKVIESSIPTTVYTDNIDSIFSQIKIEIIDEKGNKEEKNLEKSMIGEDEINLLKEVGVHEITVMFEGKTTKLKITVAEKEFNGYTVKVVYPNGEAVNGKVSVQWCTGNNCFLPVTVNEQGIAKNNLKDGEYYIHIDNIPEGYTYDPNAYTSDTNNKNVVITLLKLSEITNGDGTDTNPFTVTEGVYNVEYTEATTKGMKYFTFTPSESGKYNLRSISMDKLALNLIDPYIGFLGTSNDMNNIDISGNVEDDINFNFEFEAEANVTYTFILFVSNEAKFPAGFEFIVSKK